MKLSLLRYQQSKEDTRGIVLVNGATECVSLEDEHRDEKVPGKTRIADGIYPIQLNTTGGMNNAYEKRFPSIHRGMLEICNVPDFTNVYIHILNTEDQTEGCIGVGTDFDDLEDGRSYLKNSTVAYLKLYNKVIEAFENGEDVSIVITDLERKKIEVPNEYVSRPSNEMVRNEEFKPFYVPPFNLDDFMPGRDSWLRNATENVWDFLRGKNKAGKVFQGVAVAVVGIFTGINLEFLTGNGSMESAGLVPQLIEWIILNIEWVVAAITFIVGLFVKKPGTQKWIQSKIEVAGPAIAQAASEESEGGRKITPNEVKGILSTILNSEKQKHE